MKAPRALAAAALALAVAIGAAGCWDVHDVNDLTPVLALGFDRSQGVWTMSAEDAVVSSGGGSGAFQGALHVGHGATMSAAIDDLRSHVARRLYVGSARIVVVGQGALESDLPLIVRRLTQAQEVDETAFVLGSTSTAEALLASKDGAFGTTSVRLLKEFESPDMAGHSHVVTRLWQLQRDLFGPEQARFAAVPMFKPPDSAGASEVGVDVVGPDGRLVLALDRDQSAGLNWIEGGQGREVLYLPDGNRVEVDAVHTGAQFTDVRHLTLRVRVRATAYYVHGPALVPSPVRSHLAQLAAGVLLARTLDVLGRIKAKGVDPAGWSQMAARQGMTGFDPRRLDVAVMVHVTVQPHFSPSL